MLTAIVDYAALIAYCAISADLIIQIRHVHKRRSSADVSLWGITVRVLASTTLALKMYVVGDLYLMVGQSILALIVVAYLLVLLYYRRK